MRKILLFSIFILLTGSAMAAVSLETLGNGGGSPAKPAALPNTQLKVHDVGKLRLSVTNFGFFGSQDGEFEDSGGYYFIAPGCEFPGGSNFDYLFQGALWIGATVDTVDDFGNPALDTLVSIGNDGWWGSLFEFFPDFPPEGAIEVRSIRPPDAYPYGDTINAISEQDFFAVYSDTHTNQSYVNPDPNDEREHIPLGIEITQKSYSWSYEYAEDFVLFDFDIANIYSGVDLKNVWIGMYIDADVAHSSENPYGSEEGAQDDICGFDTVYVDNEGNRTDINTAWIADNDGQVEEGAFTFRSPRGLSGVRVVRTPSDSLEYSFNWWISNTTASYDWGPQLQSNFRGPFPGGGLGTPGGDKAKYQVMSNNEFDYDQIWCALPRWSAEGWIEPSAQASDLANGYDTRYLFAFGPFDVIPAGDTLKLTTAYICGENLHGIADNYASNLRNNTTNEGLVQEYFDNLDFTDFAINSQWADWVYDNPGVDSEEPYTDLNGDSTYTAGEPFRDYDGNGFFTEKDGYRGEFTITPAGDTFWFKGDGVPDFQGPPPPPAPRLTADTEPGTVILTWNGAATQSEPDIFSGEVDFEGYRVYMSHTGKLGEYTLIGDWDIIDYDSTWLDTNVTPPVWKLWKQAPRRLEDFPVDFDPDTSANWVPHSWNRGLSEIAINDTLYTYTIEGLSEAVGMYFAVSAYDYGNPVTSLSPLASSPSINAKYVYPIAMGEDIASVAVYPNPYKIDADYAGRGYEDPDGSGFTQFDRRIWFSGMPGKSTVRIFTLDGDLVRQLDYDPAYNSSGVIYWDLISLNTQAVVSGIYLYVIDADNGFHEIGKLAIVK
ncbi:MAG: hypothetical protein V3W18_10890 [candidate division Zixibacteria bacterium]